MGTIQVIRSTVDPRQLDTLAGTGHTVATSGRAEPGSAPAAPASDVPTLDPQQAREYVQHVQEVLDRAVPQPHRITFRRDETTKNFVIEVRNPDGSLIRQYPPEKLLNLRRKLDELSGMVIDEMT
jgi:uncharacterized FlaG/YvyC family protein